jgi:hypothetical protein
VLTGLPRSIRDLFTLRAGAAFDQLSVDRVRVILKWTTVLLLLGHGALGALSGKELLTSQYASIGLPADTTMIVGWFEIALAVAVAIRPIAGLLLFISAWKIATESLFIVSGAPVWELVERGGSYAAPLALAVLVSESYVSNAARALFGTALRGVERIASGPRLERSI